MQSKLSTIVNVSSCYSLGWEILFLRAIIALFSPALVNTLQIISLITSYATVLNCESQMFYSVYSFYRNQFFYICTYVCMYSSPQYVLRGYMFPLRSDGFTYSLAVGLMGRTQGGIACSSTVAYQSMWVGEYWREKNQMHLMLISALQKA